MSAILPDRRIGWTEHQYMIQLNYYDHDKNNNLKYAQCIIKAKYLRSFNKLNSLVNN